MISRFGLSMLLLAASATAVLAGAGPAAAETQEVAGTAVEVLAIVPVAAAFGTKLRAGSVATSELGTLTVTDTKASGKLTVLNALSSKPGHMKAAAVGCTGSEEYLAEPLSVTVTGSGVTSAGAKSISGTEQEVASWSSPITSDVLATSYSQTIKSTENLLAGCVYTLTATYTLQ